MQKNKKQKSSKVTKRAGLCWSILCSECGKDFLLKSNLNSHKVCHLSKEERDKTRTPCPECGKMYLPNTLSCHIRQVHRRILPVKRIICNFDNCGKNFISKSRLLIHQQQSHTKEFRFHCKCGKRFATRFHQETISHNCELCSASYKHVRNLTRHKKTSHKGEIDPSTGHVHFLIK